MELLANQHLEIFYSPEHAQIVRHNHIIDMFYRWTFSAIVALFQHWAYTHPERGEDPDACDEFWLNLHDRFMPGIDYTCFEDDIRMQWREVFQIFVFPFYFIEYAFAQLGAVQIWQNYLQDPNQAIEQFQHALRRGHTVSVPEFYKLAGANFSIDTKILSAARDVMKKSLIN